MDRRDFLKQVAAWSAGALLTPPVFAAEAVAPTTAAGVKPLLVVARGKDYPAVVKTAIEKLGGMGAFVKSGDKVVIKPNIGFDRAPELGATTHPDVVKTLVQLALAQGAASVKVFDRSTNDSRRCYVSSGIQAAVESIKDPRATCPQMDDRRFVPVKIERAKKMMQWDFYRDAIEADCYINVPIAKQHGLSKLTLSMKNIMGILGGNRGRIHQGIAQNLADLNQVIKPKLTMIDCTRILVRGGPSGGNPNNVKVCDTILASTDPVAADAYATGLFDLKPEQIESIVAAHEMGMGEIDLSKVNIVEV